MSIKNKTKKTSTAVEVGVGGIKRNTRRESGLCDVTDPGSGLGGEGDSKMRNKNNKPLITRKKKKGFYFFHAIII